MSHTIAALSTPTGESAIAVIRLSGDLCVEIAKSALSKDVSNSPRHAFFGKYKLLSQEIADDTVFTYFKAPNSYTGEDMLEISTHGNPYIIQIILQDLFSRGCVPATAGEFTRRSFENNKMDLSQAEAVALTISARCSRSLNAARRQLDGELGKRISDMSEKLADILALAEAYIDFPEEELPDSDKEKSITSMQNLSTEIKKLADTSKYTALVHQGINLVIAGAPNAGKSSLLNSLLGEERAIVSSQAGTTRDFISERICMGGYMFNLTDTAGIRDFAEEIEKAGIDKAKERLNLADLKILTIDSSIPESINESLLEKFSNQDTIIAINKCDLPNSSPESVEKYFEEFKSVRISCLKNDGIEELKTAIVKFVENKDIRAASDDILVSARHAQSLEEARQALLSAIEQTKNNAPAELAASDLHQALESLGEIVGKTDNEAILGRIFSKFCIGK